MIREQLFTCALAAMALCGPYYAGAQGMSINTTGATAAASAILDVNSTTQGMLVPRMDSLQRTTISSPATGLLVYQTNGITPGFYFYNGTVWTSLSGSGGSGGSGGSPTGAAGGDLAGTYPNPTIAATTAAGNDVVAAVNVSTVTVSGTHISATSVPVSSINATGTASSSTYLRGDGTWSTPSASSSGVNGVIFCQNLSSGTQSPAFMALCSGTLGTSTTTNSAYLRATVMPYSGTIDAIYAELTTELTGTSVGPLTFTIYKNGSATGLSCTLTPINTVGSTVSNSTTGGTVSVAAGDLISMAVTGNSTSSTTVAMNITVHMQ